MAENAEVVLQILMTIKFWSIKSCVLGPPPRLKHQNKDFMIGLLCSWLGVGNGPDTHWVKWVSPFKIGPIKELRP